MDELEKTAVLQFQQAGWETTIKTLWPTLYSKPFSAFHRRTWAWADTIMPGKPSPGYITIWPRGAGKSSTAETVLAYLGIMRRRNYGWYVSATQQSADDHVMNIATDLLTAEGVEKYFPSIANRSIDKYGKAEAWRRNRLITQDGFAVDALGLDVAVRGRKIGDQRPDFIIFDDIDEQYDSPEQTQKKIDIIANKIIPAGTPHTVIMGAQNLITSTGIFAGFANKTSQILTDATVDGPIPAIYDLQVNGNEIVGGKPSWPEGLGIAQCQHLINQIGIAAFLVECQHDVHQTQGALWTRSMIQYADRPTKIDDYNIGIDPAMSDSKRADETGIYVAGLSDKKIYILENHSGRLHPSRTKQIAFELYEKYQCHIHIEIDNGGEWLVESLIDMGIPRTYVKGEKSRGVSKYGRAQPLADKYKEEQVFHCKKFEKLENQMVSWIPEPNAKSPDHVDALVWATLKYIEKKVRPTRGYGYAWKR